MHSPRPAFVAVRDAIVCHGCVGGIVVKETGNGLSKSRSCERCDGSGYDAENAEAAIERLHSAGLYPWRFDDETAPRWWCERCDGIGLVCTTDGENEFDTPCRCYGPSFREIESVVSLGAHTIVRAVGIAGEIAAKAGVPAARVMWRVMPRLEARTPEGARSLAGDIVAGLGFKETTTGDTLCDRDNAVILERMEFPEPVITIAPPPCSRPSSGRPIP